MRLNYCCVWAGDRAKTWSGTCLSLERALEKRFDCLTSLRIRGNVIDRAPDVAERYSWDAVAGRIHDFIEQDVRAVRRL